MQFMLLHVIMLLNLCLIVYIFLLHAGRMNLLFRCVLLPVDKNVVFFFFACRIGSGERHGPKITSSTAGEWTLTETGK